MQNAIDGIKDAVKRIEHARDITNIQRFDKEKTKDSMADTINKIGRSNGELEEINNLVKGIEELLNMQDIMKKY